MPIYKPIERTIHADDFRDKAYSFIVESVLDSDKSPGIVLISTSAGYLLTTSLTNEPKREQILRYSLQPDDSWIATTVVTLLVIEESPISGTVVIRDSSAETILLTIDAISTSLKHLDSESLAISESLAVSELDSPVLTVSESVLTFAGTSTGKPSFQVITIAQQNSNAPVLLTTDAPDYFQLATDSHPAFAPSLTLTPSPVGTYVHIRYNANNYGLHTGQLTIHSSSGNETVALRGRNAVLLPAIISSSEQAMPRKRGIGLLALMFVVGLAYAGYSYRCQLLPDLCEEIASNQITNEVSVPIPVNSTDASSKKEADSREKISATVTKPIGLPTQPASVSALIAPSVKQPIPDVSNKQYNVTTSRSVIRSATNRRTYANQGAGDAVDKRPRRRTVTPVPITEESDLERELNHNSQNQL